MKKPMVLSNVDVGDEVFESRSHGHWNATRAMRDCVAGKHKAYEHDVAEVMTAADDTEFDEAKVAALVADPKALLSVPAIIFVVQNNRLWLIDGTHRIRALARLGVKTCLGWVIEEADSARYRVLYNGDPYPPWQKPK
jgi:hypothetical protein